MTEHNVSVTQASVPSVYADLFSPNFRADPFATYREIRDAGPVCYLSRHGLYAVSRYDEVKAVLSDWGAFSSASGVTMNELSNARTKGSVIASDPPAHTQLRKAVVRPLAPGKLAALKGRLAELAQARIADLKGAGPQEMVSGLATLLPVAVVSDLVGLPEEGRERMLDWAAAAFNASAPQGTPQVVEPLPVLGEMVQYLSDPTLPQRFKPGSWAADMWASVEVGDLSREDFPAIIQAYITPSLDTTIYGTGNLLWLLANNPDQWDLLKSRPSLISRCVNETLRIESPALGFSRALTRDVSISGTVVPAGARVQTLLAAANRDERHYSDPGTFDITRDASDHVAFGGGIHRCAGGNLAMLEITTILGELLRQVDKIELVSARRSDSLTLRGFSNLEMVFH